MRIKIWQLKMKTGLLIIIGISVSVFLMGTILYPTINETTFDDDNPHDIPTALSDVPPIHPESEPIFTDTLSLNNNPELVKRILDHCDSAGVKLSVGLLSSNGTHIITNNTCEWQSIEKYESDKTLNHILSICEHDIRDTKNEFSLWSNATHYINNNDCEWKPKIISWVNNQTLTDVELQTVLDSCNNDSPHERMLNVLRYTNETHVFLNLGCEWKTIGKFMGY